MHLTYDAATDAAYLSLRPLAQGECVGPTLLLETDRASASEKSSATKPANARSVSSRSVGPTHSP